MRAALTGLGLVIAISLLGAGVEAKPKPKAKPKAAKKAALPAVATKETTVAIEKLMGGFKWGMSSEQIKKILEKDIRAEMEPVIRATADPMAQDRVRREMMDKVKQMKASLVKFEGKSTPWDVSLVDKEFAHKNNESMIPVWGKKDRRFFLFHQDRLWKLYIAFNAELYDGKNFEDFAGVMETRFGRAERRYTTTLKGDAKMSHLAWPPSDTTVLRAIDNTGFYGNFCLVLTDRKELPTVRANRKVNSPRRDYSDPLIEAVTKGGGTEGELSGGEDSPGETEVAPGKKASGKKVSSEEMPPPARKKKINEKNPLDGLDL